MSAILLDGKRISQEIKSQIQQKISALPSRPGLTVLLVGDDPASAVYVRNKERACQTVGITSSIIKLPSSTAPESILKTIDELNQDNAVHGILCQFPLPSHLKSVEHDIIYRINPQKDVDGFHPLSPHTPCTPKGIMTLLRQYQLPLSGKHAVVLGRSNLVGKPISGLLLDANATVTMTHSKTNNLPDLLHMADLVVAAIGRPAFVQGEWLKPGSIMVDVGISRTNSGLVGDVDFPSASEVAAYITPVPGGIGPMTVASLLENVLDAYQLQTTIYAKTS